MSMHFSSPLRKLRVAVIICCLILIIGILGYAFLTNRETTVLAKDEITDNVQALGGEDYGYTFVSSYLKKYGIGNINSYKMNAIESQLESDFYKELPEERQIAKDTALLFVEYYYDVIDLENKKEVTDALLKCFFSSIGDPYAFYRTEEEFAEFIGSLEGGREFVGIGVHINQETLEIQMVYPDSGAAEAGIKPRDVIYAVDGVTLEEASAEELVSMIAGEVDSTVKVTVRRGDELIDFTVTRKIISERTVLYDIDQDKVGYIQITQFLQNTPAEFKEAVDYCEANGAVALIIDMRYNPGGLLTSVVDVIDYLAPDSESRRIGSYTQSGLENVYYTKDGHSVDLPIAVLCNEGTASAGELFTAAMRDYGEEGVLDTVIVGTTTYGKGVAQNSYSLYDMSGITYTIGYFNPPSDVNFDGIGVIPEYEVEEVSGKDAPFECAKEEILKLTKGGTAVNLGVAA